VGQNLLWLKSQHKTTRQLALAGRFAYSVATPKQNHMTDQPFEIIAPNARNRWLITCDHATNHVPDHVNDGSLGLSSREMGRHIAFDIGAAGVTRALAQALDARAILSKFSRLVT